MPIYEYRCSACGHRAEILHGIHDSGPNFCLECGTEGTMRKGIVAAAVVFKGSGWAKKDRRTAARSSNRDSKDGPAEAKPSEGKTYEAKASEAKPSDPGRSGSSADPASSGGSSSDGASSSGSGSGSEGGSGSSRGSKPLASPVSESG